MNTLKEMFENRTPISGKIILADLAGEFFKIEFQNPENGKLIYGILPFKEYSVQKFIKLTKNTGKSKILSNSAVFAVGQTVSCHITDLSKDNIYLSQKSTQIETFSSLHEGSIVHCKITAINKNLTFVKLPNNLIALIPIIELSASRYVDIKNWVNVGDEIPGVITKKESDGKIIISRKKYYHYYEPIEINQVRYCKISTPIDTGYFVEINPGYSGIMDNPLDMPLDVSEGEIVRCVIHKKRLRPDGVTAYNLRYFGKWHLTPQHIGEFLF